MIRLAKGLTERAANSRWLHWLGSIIRHPVWHYSLPQILKCVKDDWDGPASREEMEALICHAHVHSNSPDAGYKKMTSMQKYKWQAIWKKAVERQDATAEVSGRAQTESNL